jgi:anthranilate synthase
VPSEPGSLSKTPKIKHICRVNFLQVVTVRAKPRGIGLDPADIDQLEVDGAFALAVLSPGPGNPTDFQVVKTIQELERRQIAIFGVCLGLQGIVERYGGELGQLPVPVHGKPSNVLIKGDQQKGIFSEIPCEIICGRYHSLYCSSLPEELSATAVTYDGCVMGVRHKTLPVAAVQFHPESILTAPGMGVKILANAVKFLHY